jgi:DNA-binding GntR family transcriptional regulator
MAENPLAEEWEARHRAFHRTLISACGSPWLLHFCAVLQDQFDRYRRMAPIAPGAQRRIGIGHGEILAATLRRDAEEAAALLARHIRDAAVGVAEGLSR